MRAYGTDFIQAVTPSAVIEARIMLWILRQAIRKIRIGIIGINIQALLFHTMVIQIRKHPIGSNKYPFPDMSA